MWRSILDHLSGLMVGRQFLDSLVQTPTYPFLLQRVLVRHRCPRLRHRHYHQPLHHRHHYNKSSRVSGMACIPLEVPYLRVNQGFSISFHLYLGYCNLRSMGQYIRR